MNDYYYNYYYYIIIIKNERLLVHTGDSSTDESSTDGLRGRLPVCVPLSGAGDEENEMKTEALTQDVFGAQLSKVLELKVYVDDGHAACGRQHDDIAARNFLED